MANRTVGTPAQSTGETTVNHITQYQHAVIWSVQTGNATAAYCYARLLVRSLRARYPKTVASGRYRALYDTVVDPCPVCGMVLDCRFDCPNRETRNWRPIQP